MTSPRVPAPRFSVAICHGEGETIYHAVDGAAPEGEQPAVVRSWSTRDDPKGASALWLARDFCERHNAKEFHKVGKGETP